MAQINQKHYEICSSAILAYKNKFVLLYDHKKSHYVLPQGHKRKKELLLNAALREAREETGFQELTFVRKLGKYQYHFKKGEKMIYKTVNVYLIVITNNKRLKNTQRANENFTIHLFSFKDSIKIIKWKQDKKYIKLAKRFLII